MGMAEEHGRRKRHNPKRAGELSEAAFLLKAKRLGFLVAKPWGDSERYDFILDSGSRLWRVQLKSTVREQARGYQVRPVYGGCKTAYTPEQIDALVVHIAPCNTWYVLPVEAITLSKSLQFYPDTESKSARWESYREAWHLLRG